MNEEEIKSKVEGFVEDYASQRDIFDRFCQSLVSLCETLLERNNIESYYVRSRSKNPESLKEKLLTVYPNESKAIIEKILDPKFKQYKGWRDICDLSALRIVFAFEKDVYAFIEILKREIGDNILSVKEQDKSGGYESIHLLVKLQKNRINLPEYQDYKGLTCEIQLRTILDHAWSETSHKICYKPDTSFQEFATSRAKTIISKELKSIKEELIDPAKIRFNVLYDFYTSTNNGAKILDPSELNALPTYDENNIIYGKLINLINSLSEGSYVLPLDFRVCKFVNDVISTAKKNKQTEKDGDTLINISVKCLELLELLRYQDIGEVLRLLGDFRKIDDPKISKQIETVYKRIFKYDYHLLKSSGLVVQKLGLDFIEDNFDSLDVGQLKIIFTELLDPAFEGSQMKDENTFTWLSGPLVVNKELIQIRRKSIDLLLSRFFRVKAIDEKIQIIQILDNALRFPHSGKYGDDFEKMIAEDANYLISKYQNIVFDQNGDIVADLPIVQEIESQLKWITRRPIKKAEDSAKKFIEKLDKHETYFVSRLLATSIRDYRGNKDWKEAEAERKIEINKFFESLTAENIDKYGKIIEEVGRYLKRSEAWEWHGFASLLCRIAKERPVLAIKILDNSKLIFQKFLIEILEGFRKAGNWVAWDKYANIAIETKDIKILEQVFWSINLIDRSELKDHVRDSDVALLGHAIKGQDEFGHYKIAKSGDISTHNSIIWALIAIYNYNPRKVELLIQQEFEQNKKFMTMYLHTIVIGIIRGQINLKGWGDKILNIITNHLIEVKDLDHDLQSILAEVVKEKPDSALIILTERINRTIRQTREEKIIDKYEAIPDYFNEGLVEILRENKKTIPALKKLVEGMVRNKNFLFNWKVGELVNRIGGEVQTKILDDLIDSKDDKKLEAATALMREFESPNIELCFKIIANSSGPKSKVWNSVAARIYTTGVVSGEYGIKNHYESVLKQFEDIKNKQPKNKNIQQFASQMIKSLKSSISREDKRVKEELLLRKIEFES